jgi:hypothetical protein
MYWTACTCQPPSALSQLVSRWSGKYFSTTIVCRCSEIRSIPSRYLEPQHEYFGRSMILPQGLHQEYRDLTTEIHDTSRYQIRSQRVLTWFPNLTRSHVIPLNNASYLRSKHTLIRYSLISEPFDNRCRQSRSVNTLSGRTFSTRWYRKCCC